MTGLHDTFGGAILAWVKSPRHATHAGENARSPDLVSIRHTKSNLTSIGIILNFCPSMNVLFAFFPNEPFRSMHFLLQKAHALFQQFLRRQRIFDADVVVCRDPHRRAQPTERPLYIG